MSATVFDQDYMPPPGVRPIKARPMGTFAAAMIGASATLVLAASLSFVPAPIQDEARSVPADGESPASANTASTAPDARAGEQKETKQALMFELGSPEFANVKKTASSRALDNGGREDSLTFGEFADGGVYLRFDISQSAADKSQSDFYLDVTQHARTAGLAVKKIFSPTPLVTRFGRFESAEIKLTPAQVEGGAERSCLAVRLVNASISLEMTGIACGASAKPIDRTAMGCIIDQIDYRPSGDNKALEQFLSSADAARGQGCAAQAEVKKPKAPAAAHAKVNKKKNN